MVTVVETGYVNVYRNPDKDGGSNFFAWYLKRWNSEGPVRRSSAHVTVVSLGGTVNTFMNQCTYECTYESLH